MKNKQDFFEDYEVNPSTGLSMSTPFVDCGGYFKYENPGDDGFMTSDDDAVESCFEDSGIQVFDDTWGSFDE